MILRPLADFLASGLSTGLCAGLCAGTGLVAQEPAPPPPANYVAHEWGTFTSMVGKGGIVLEGLQHEEEALPGFVHDLLKIEEFERQDTKLPASRVTQKMETPVIYFHTDEPLQVQVSVWFRQGLMTQFYPLPDEVLPVLEEARKARVDMSKIEGSQLTWLLDLVPRSKPLPAEIPAVSDGNPWAIARQVVAAAVRTRPEKSPARVEAEHYVFYRGLGRWQPPVELQAARGGRAEFTNHMQAPIPFVAVLDLDEAGGRYQVGKPLAPGATQAFDLGGLQRDPDREHVARDLGAEVLHALVESGLYHDEARAMVATWSRSWFQKNGARVVYLLPRRQVDEVLPLNLAPAPKELVRTLVGRLEFITPELQDRVEQAVRDHDSREPAVAAAAQATLRALDRFLEPHLRNVAQRGSDAAVRRAAARLLAAVGQ